MILQTKCLISFDNITYINIVTFVCLILIRCLCTVYINLRLEGNLEHEFSIFEKEKKVVVKIGNIPVIIFLSGEISVGFEMGGILDWSGYIDNSGTLTMGLKYDNGWIPIRAINIPNPVFETGQNIYTTVIFSFIFVHIISEYITYYLIS